MKLYVCWGTFDHPLGHACGRAHAALEEAGHDPEVERVYGLRFLPEFMNFTPGRKKVKELSGRNWVPVLVTDQDEVIAGSKRIIEWAGANAPDKARNRPE